MEIKLLSSGVNLCDEQTINKSNVKFAIVYYKGTNNIAKMDYINLTTNVKETYTIGDVRFSVASYFLMRKSSIASYPSIISIRNGDFNYPTIVLDDNNDYIARVAGPIQPSNPGLSQPGSKCPGNCLPGDTDDCSNFFNGSCNYTFDGPGNGEPTCPTRHTTLTLYNSASYQQLSNTLFSKYNILYDFMDNFLTKTTKGKRYLIDYYTLGELRKSGDARQMSLSQMVDLANLIINNTDKFTKLINHTANANVVLYTVSEANTYKAFLTSLRSLSSHTKWTTIMNMVENDINANQGRTVSQVVASMN